MPIPTSLLGLFDYVKPWAEEDDDADNPRMTFDEAKRAAVTRLTAALLRASIDHVPPIFRVTTFAEVANNVGGKSDKKSLLRLQKASRDISDAVLHQRIRRREVLPTAIQVDFKNELDVLLSEIVRQLG